MRIRTPSGKQFALDAGESLLDAALRQEVVLGHGCRTGRCSSCKAKAPPGSTTPLHEELGLSPAEQAAGWILTCVRTALADFVLEVDDLGTVQLPPARTLPCRIQSLEHLAADVVKVLLRLPPASKFDYVAGQYIDVIGHDGLRRSYSIANAPAADKLIELHVRQVEGGAMSDYWFGRARPNDLLRLNGPLGTFFLRNAAAHHLVYLATGTGMAPVKAMLERLVGEPPESRPKSITVYWGGRTVPDLYWNPSGLDLPHRFVPVLSRASSDWAGARGHVQQALLADQPNLQDTVVYACGSNSMIQSARQQLVDAGLPDRRFNADAFVCSARSEVPRRNHE